MAQKTGQSPGNLLLKPEQWHDQGLRQLQACASTHDQAVLRSVQLFDVHPNQITTWRSQLLNGAAGVFGADSATESTEPAIDFLAGALEKAGLLPSAKR